MKKSVATAVSALLVLGSTAAFANDVKPVDAKGPDGHVARFAEHFKKADTNSDGAISKDEWRAQGDEMFAERDTNKDGKISQDEMKAFHQARMEKWKENHADAGAKPVAPTTPEKK